MMDIPCGDLHWMLWVDLTGIRYHGADISNVVIQQNKERIERPLALDSDNAKKVCLCNGSIVELLVLDAERVFCR